MAQRIFLAALIALLVGGCSKSGSDDPKTLAYGEGAEMAGNYKLPDGRTLRIGIAETALLSFELAENGKRLLDWASKQDRAYSAASRWRIVYDSKGRLWICSSDFTSSVWALNEAGQYQWHSLAENLPFMLSEVPDQVTEFRK